MSYSRRSRYSRSRSRSPSPSPSPSPYKPSRSISRSLSRSRSHHSCDAENPGNNLYVTGLSTWVSKRDLEKHFATEGKVEDVRLVVDPWTQESRGFGFVTMSTVEEADRCIKYLDRSMLEGSVITVEKARRRRGRTPTPGRYLGLRTVHVRRRSPSYSRYSSERDRSRSRSYSPYYSWRRQSYTSHHRRGAYSPYYSRGRSYSRSRSPSYTRSPVSRRDQSYSPYYYRCYLPDDRYYRRRYRSASRVPCPDYHNYRSRCRPCAQSISTGHRRNLRRSYSRSISPRRLRRSYSRSMSPKYSRRRYSQSVSPSPRKRSASPGSDKREISGNSRSFRSHSRSPSADLTSRSGSISVRRNS